MKLLRALLLVLGLVFLGVLVVMHDPAAIFAAITGLSWRLPGVAVFPFVVVTTFDTLRWKYSFLRARVGLRVSGHQDTSARVDRGLARFYREEPRRLALSIAFHFVAWLLGVVEVYLMLRFLGVPVSLTTATIIEAFGTAVRFATFLVPASVGAQEGGYVVTFVALGLPASTAVAFGLARRVREILWIAVGFVIFALLLDDPRPDVRDR